MSFVKSYIVRWGWLDGWAGLHASFLAALATYFRGAIHSETEHPASTRRTLIDDRWSQLKVFADDELAAHDASNSEAEVRAAA